uniref:Vesicle associated membrane protein 4 n=1 Tax=Oryzias melastigma TaxID=30732 RepID=A0A3B3BXJ4_ORYME
MWEPEWEEQPKDNMPPKFKRHLNDDEVTGSVRSERRNLLEEDSDDEDDFFLRGPSEPRFGVHNNNKIKQESIRQCIRLQQPSQTAAQEDVVERHEDEDHHCTGCYCSAADYHHSSNPQISLATDEEEKEKPVSLFSSSKHHPPAHRLQVSPPHPRFYPHCSPSFALTAVFPLGCLDFSHLIEKMGQKGSLQETIWKKRASLECDCLSFHDTFGLFQHM